MGFKFENQYFFDKCLPMGASISCSLFEKFLTALHWFIQQESNNDNILHYLDDFLFGGKAETKQCCNTLKVFQESCKVWGVPLADDKTVEPTKVLVLLGIELDTINMVMRLPQEKVSEIKERTISCLNSHKITLRELVFNRNIELCVSSHCTWTNFFATTYRCYLQIVQTPS
jgi:hypothetical protein